MDSFGFLKVAAAVPHVRVGDCDFNAERMAAMAEEAAQRGVEIVAFPELALTAYTCGDLLLQPALLDAADEALARLVRDTRKLPLTMIAGAPLRHAQTLYNCAVVFTQGRILGVVPKTYIPTIRNSTRTAGSHRAQASPKRRSPSRGRLRISAQASRSRSTARSSAWSCAKTSGRQCRPRRTWHSAARR